MEQSHTIFLVVNVRVSQSQTSFCNILLISPPEIKSLACLIYVMRRQFALLDDFLFPLQLPSETFHVDTRRCFSRRSRLRWFSVRGVSSEFLANSLGPIAPGPAAPPHLVNLCSNIYRKKLRHYHEITWERFVIQMQPQTNPVACQCCALNSSNKQ